MAPRSEDVTSSSSFSRPGMRSGAALGVSRSAASAKGESRARRWRAGAGTEACGPDSLSAWPPPVLMRTTSARLLAPTSGRNSPVPGW